MKLIVLYSVSLTLSLIYVPVINASRFRCDYIYFLQAEGWFKLHTTPSDRGDAKRLCNLEDADLASPTTDEVKTAVQWLMKNASMTAVQVDIRMPYSTSSFSVIAPELVNNLIPYYNTNGEKSWRREEVAMVMTESGGFQRACEKKAPFVCHKKKRDIKMLNEDCGNFDRGYRLDRRTGYCYKFHGTRDIWEQAVYTCSAEGGHLAIINSDVEAQVMRDVFARNPADPLDSMPREHWMDTAFLGFGSIDGLHWSTINGETLQKAGYDKWSSGEPNNQGGDEFCGAVGRNGLLFDDPCTRHMPFICERAVDGVPLCEDRNRTLEFTPEFRRKQIQILKGT